MSDERAFDTIVIGGSSGGVACATALTQGGQRRVALIERERVGGECAFSACVPSKVLLRSEQALAELCARSGFAASRGSEARLRQCGGVANVDGRWLRRCAPCGRARRGGRDTAAARRGPHRRSGRDRARFETVRRQRHRHCHRIRRSDSEDRRHRTRTVLDFARGHGRNRITETFAGARRRRGWSRARANVRALRLCRDADRGRPPRPSRRIRNARRVARRGPRARRNSDRDGCAGWERCGLGRSGDAAIEGRTRVRG